MISLFGRLTAEEKKILEQIRSLKSLKVTSRGGMSISSEEIINNKNFIEACKSAKRMVEESRMMRW